jgi:urease accessory protein
MPITGTITITTATITRAMAISDASLLQLIWLASPALPIGGFSYSEGLESAVDRGLVGDEKSATQWLADQLHLTLARSDLAVIGEAIPAWREGNVEGVERLNDWIMHTRESSESRQQTEQMGRSMVEWLKSVQPQTAARATHPLSYPLAFALAASACDATPRECLLAFAFGWAENMMQSAIKSVPLGQSAGQRILLRLAHEIPAAVDAALALPDDRRQAFSPMLAILSAQHEAQYSRLFRS